VANNLYHIVSQYPKQVATVFYRYGVIDAVSADNLALAILRFGKGFSDDLIKEINEGSFYGASDRKSITEHTNDVYGSTEIQKMTKDEYQKGIQFGYNLAEYRFKKLLIVTVVMLVWLIILTYRVHRT
jgi:hypothetical protein